MKKNIIMGVVKIREITPGDNKEVARLVREVLVELGVPKIGTAYADSTLDDMFAQSRLPGTAYFVVEEDGKILGGAGIAPLEQGGEQICELQKMYFSKEARGRGIGSKMMETCLERAREFGYAQCYLETLPYMEAAQRLYKRYGFGPLDAPMGNTGHFSCTVWMLRDL